MSETLAEQAELVYYVCGEKVSISLEPGQLAVIFRVLELGATDDDIEPDVEPDIPKAIKLDRAELAEMRADFKAGRNFLTDKEVRGKKAHV
jgi:hypothetical protein